MSTLSTIQTITFDGGCLCFDFINTVSSRMQEPIREYLLTYRDVLLFSERQAILTKPMLTALQAYADQHPEEAQRVLAEMIVVRENLFLLFSSIAADEPVSLAVLEAFNAKLPEVFSHHVFRERDGKLALDWQVEATDLYLPFRMALKSAYDLLTTQEPKRLKKCGACGWLFLDKSKNNTRRWCDMQACGSIEKSKRYYHRKKQQN